MPRHAWREDELLRELQRVADELDRLPSRDVLKIWGEEPPTAYEQVFGSFDSALRLIQDPEDIGVERSRQELIQELQRMAFQKNGMVRPTDIRRESEFSMGEYTREFGSLQKALKQAGLIESVEEYDRQFRDSKVLGDIQRVAYDTDGRLTLREYLEAGEFSWSAIQDRWGSWKRALVEADVVPAAEKLEPSRQELVQDIKRVGEKLGRQPRRDEYVETGMYSINKVNASMGWLQGLALAGYELPNEGREIEEADLREAFEELERELGRVPTEEEMRELGKYSHGPYIRAFGSWEEAKEELSLGGQSSAARQS